MAILYIVLPIFLIIGAGFLLRKKNIIDDSWAHVLNGFVYYVSLPAIIFVSFWQINWMDKNLWHMVGFNALAIVLFSAALLAVLSFFKLNNKTKASVFLAAVVGNTVYMGFPIVGGAATKENFSIVIGAATAHLVLGLLLGILVSEFFVVKSKKIKIYVFDFIKNPLIISLALGIAFSFLKFQGGIMDIIQKPLVMLGATASPVALFALGSFLHGKLKKQEASLAVWATVAKLLAFPLAIFLLAKVFNLSAPNQSISVLISTMPAAVTCFVIAEKYKLNQKLVANAIVLSTAVSIITIPIFLLLFI